MNHYHCCCLFHCNKASKKEPPFLGQKFFPRKSFKFQKCKIVEKHTSVEKWFCLNAQDDIKTRLSSLELAQRMKYEAWAKSNATPAPPLKVQLQLLTHLVASDFCEAIYRQRKRFDAPQGGERGVRSDPRVWGLLWRTRIGVAIVMRAHMMTS